MNSNTLCGFVKVDLGVFLNISSNNIILTLSQYQLKYPNITTHTLSSACPDVNTENRVSVIFIVEGVFQMVLFGDLKCLQNACTCADRALDIFCASGQVQILKF